jgi:hypothetical protein
MSGPSALGNVLYEAESSFAENVTTFATRLPVLGMVDVSGLGREKLQPEWMVQRRNDGHPHIKGKQIGSFRIRVRLPGHGTSTAGAGLAVSALGTFLGRVFGTNALSLAAGQTATGGTATVVTTSAASGISPHGVVRIGARNDGDGGGQFYQAASHTGSDLTVFNDLLGAPANGAVIYATEMIYPLETVNTVTSCRFQLATANGVFNCHGCFPMSATITGLNPGELPTAEIEIGVAASYPTTSTFPISTAVVQHNPAAIANGSFVLQERGTTTRSTYNIRDLAVNYTLGIQADEGPGGIWPGQTITSVKRIPDTCVITFTVDAEADSANPTWHAFWEDEEQEFYAIWSGGTEDAKALGMVWQRCCVTGKRPSQSESNGINRVPVELTAYSGDVTTNDLTTAMMIIAMS